MVGRGTRRPGQAARRVSLWASSCPFRGGVLQHGLRARRDKIRPLGVDVKDTRSAAVSLLAHLRITYAHAVDCDKRLGTSARVEDVTRMPVPVGVSLSTAMMSTLRSGFVFVSSR